MILVRDAHKMRRALPNGRRRAGEVGDGGVSGHREHVQDVEPLLDAEHLDDALDGLGGHFFLLVL